MTQASTHWQGVAATEHINAATRDIDQMTTAALLTCINQQDHQVPDAVAQSIPAITQVVDAVIKGFANGGRLFYIGAGTSGRLAVLDASEMPPTFGTDPELVQGIIAGGDNALRNAAEGAEDVGHVGRQDILDKHLTPHDVVVGISASGGAAYVVDALKAANEKDCFTAAMTCNSTSLLGDVADVAIITPVGPEVVTGSTRMKAGTAQKLVLNMISTAAMVKIGKTYENLMVDVRATNVKLKDRAVRLVSLLGQVDAAAAITFLDNSDWQVKPAIVMARLTVSFDEAQTLLKASNEKLRTVLEKSSG